MKNSFEKVNLKRSQRKKILPQKGNNKTFKQKVGKPEDITSAGDFIPGENTFKINASQGFLKQMQRKIITSIIH